MKISFFFANLPLWRKRSDISICLLNNYYRVVYFELLVRLCLTTIIPLYTEREKDAQ